MSDFCNDHFLRLSSPTIHNFRDTCYRKKCQIIVTMLLNCLCFNLHCFNPLTAILFNRNFHPLEGVSRWRDPQLQVSENYSDLTKWRSTNFKSCWLMSLLILNRFKSWYIMCYKKCKKRIWTAPVVKGLKLQLLTQYPALNYETYYRVIPLVIPLGPCFFHKNTGAS